MRCIDKPCLVLAGAGSGKTRVITRKIAWLIEQGYSPAQVHALTFTNKAAREMQRRVKSLLRKTGARGPEISTFHTLGLKILQREASLLGYRRGFSIMDARDVEACLGELGLRDVADRDTTRAAMFHISRWKNDFIDPQSAQRDAADDSERALARLYQDYQKHLLACNAVDFDDLIMLPVQLFRGHAEVLHRWQNRIRYLLVDEYQDTNTSQYELIRLLCRLQQNLTVVGDDDQSIYAWRGARPENIRLLQRDFESLEVIKLEQNYRSSGRILHAANCLIANNSHLFEKKLWSASGSGDYIRVLPCKTAEEEADRIVIDIQSRRFQEHTPYLDFAILYRSNYQSRNYEKALREQGVPYQVNGGSAFFERREIKDLMAFLRLVVNPDDDQALLRIINVPRREIGTSTIQQLSAYARERHCSLGAAMQQLGLRERLGRRGWARLQNFADLVNELAQDADRHDAMSFCRNLASRLDYRDWLEQTSASPKQADSAIENVEELISWIGNLQANREDRSLQAMVSLLSLMTILENNEEKQERDAVQLMTLHAAKGLEFPRVYLTNFEEDSLPHHQARDAEGVEEERRLAYVGITRAETSLTLSYARTRQRFGEMQHCEPSRFLYELPEDDLDGAEHVESRLSDGEKHQQGLDVLANLQAMLGSEKV